MSSQKIYWIIGALLIVAGAIAFSQKESSPQFAEQVSVREGWKTYENKQIGIAFEYPEDWGEIHAVEEEVCVKTPDSVWGNEEAAQEKELTGDPCISIYLRSSIQTESSRALSNSFLMTTTPLYEKYQPARGFNWLGSGVRAKFEGYCARFEERVVPHTYPGWETPEKSCEIFTNANGVHIAKSFHATDGMSGFYGWQYNLETPNAFFPKIILGSWGAVDNPEHAIFADLVDSIRFIPIE